MALPPMNPDKTAAGIVVDPKTLERVVPTSARKDGTLRKELKIRPGFTPQEDVGRFRGTRQKASEQTQSRIPGSDRIRPPPSKPENPFSQDQTSGASTKTKAQLKNEKRRANKKTATKNWDESDDEEDDGAIGDAFKAGDEARSNAQPVDNAPAATEVEDEKDTETKKEEPAWPIEDGGQGMIGEEGPGMGADGGGIPDDPVPIDPKPEMENQENGQGEGTTAILSPPPPGHPAKDPAAPSVPQKSKTAPPAPVSTSTEPEWRTASSRRKPSTQQAKQDQKPHPIQGGRKGPIGLAHPPPIEREQSSSKPRPNRDNRPKRPPGQGPGGRTDSSAGQPASKPQEKKPEPRVRKEVKVRESGLGSLADRVRGLVIGSQDDGKKKKEKSAEGSAPTA